MKVVSRDFNGAHRSLTVPTQAHLVTVFQSKRIMSDPQHLSLDYHKLRLPPIYPLEVIAITLERTAKPIPGHLV